MTAKIRFAKIPTTLHHLVGAGVLSYQEFCVLTYMDAFCGITNDRKNPYMLGKHGIMKAFQISGSRAKNILTSLVKKGFVHPIYRISLGNGTIIKTKSLAKVYHIRFEEGGQYRKTFYMVTKKPRLNKDEP